MEEDNRFNAFQDTSQMDANEYKEYGYSRMKSMLRMERNAKQWYSSKSTPFQKMIMEMAVHHVDDCERTYGISRQNVRI